MNFIGYSFFLFLTMLLQSCENNVLISSKSARYVASNYTEKIDGSESLSKGIKELLNEEQNLHNKDLWGKNAFSSQTDPKYAPETNPKFPLPYYLIPETDAKFLYLTQFDPKVRDQLYLLVSGTKYYKLFVHPESEIFYDFLKNAYRYIGPTQTEFMASPSYSHRSLIVWNQKNKNKTPFIVKVSLDKSVVHGIQDTDSKNEVERSIKNQKVLNRIGKENLDKMDIKFFPESAGLIFDRRFDGAPDKSGGQLIREIPKEVIKGEKKWLSISALVSPNHGSRPLIMEVIKQSGLSSYDFFEKIMIKSYLDMFENISLKNGINFEPHSQNLLIETTSKLKPTGKWILRDFGGVWTDPKTTIRNNGPLGIGNNSKSKHIGGRSNYISSYVFFYKKQIFDTLLDEVVKFDLTINESKIIELKDKIDNLYLTKINDYFKLNLKITPDIQTYQKIEKIILDQAILGSNSDEKPLKNSSELKAFFERKKFNQEWIELSDGLNKLSDFFATDHGIYEISENKVLSLALFNQADLESYKKNNGSLVNILHDFQYKPREGCFQMMKNFFR